MSEAGKIAVLVSGSGTNLQALIDSAHQENLGGRIALVISNRPDVRALERAAEADIPNLCLPHQEYPDRDAFDAALLAKLDEVDPKCIVLAGFDRILSPQFIRNYRHRILNVHPALLPSFPGLHAVKQALEYGTKQTGVTVHFIDEGVDTGPIILQEAVEIRENESKAALLERVHAVERRLLPEAIRLFCSDRLKIDGRQVRIL